MNAAQIVLMLLALAAVTYCRRTPLNSKKIAVSNNVKTISTVTADASDDTNTPSNSQIYSAVALVSGTTVGAGILALPSVAQETGFLPSTGALVGSWLFMLATGCLIAEVSCNLVKTDAKFVNAGILAMSKHLLGEKMAAVTGLFYLFIHYALLVAYIAEAGGIITDTLHINKLLGPLLFTGVIGGIAALGPDGIVEKLNNSFAIVVIASFFSLVLLGISGLHPQYLLHQNIYAVLHTIPVMFVALVYHNIVPSICSQLSYHKQSIKKVLFVGTIIPTLMFVVWNAVILGSIDSSLYTSMKIDPLDILRTNSQSGFIGPMISLFSMAAIVTSFIGFIYGLMEFFADVFTGKSKKDASLAGLVLLPPMVIAMADPNIFMNALDYAGTYDISMLFGVLPISLAFVLRSSMINNGKVSTENSDSNDIASRISSIAMTKESDRNRKYDGGVYLERQPFLSNKENQLEDGMLSTLSAGKTAKMSATATKAIAYDMFIPGGNITLAIMLTFTAFVIFQKIIA